jgi:hypothetical protein
VTQGRRHPPRHVRLDDRPAQGDRQARRHQHHGDVGRGRLSHRAHLLGRDALAGGLLHGRGRGAGAGAGHHREHCRVHGGRQQDRDGGDCQLHLGAHVSLHSFGEVQVICSKLLLFCRIEKTPALHKYFSRLK